MTYFKHIKESAAKFGLDKQEALQLHNKLCNSSEPGAQFAAQLVYKILEKATEADNLMTQLMALTEETE